MARERVAERRVSGTLDTSERRFRAIFETAAIGIVTTTAEGVITEANAAFEQMLGYPPGGLEGKTVAEITHPGDSGDALALLDALGRGERDSYQVEKLYVRSDGSPVWGRVSASIIRDASGTPALIVAAVEDVHARRVAEQQLREAEVRYRTLVEELPLVTYVDALDERSSNIYTSPQIERLLGYTPAEWQSDPNLFVTLLHPDDRQRVLEEVDRTNETGERFVAEYRLMARHGRPVWVRDESVVVRDADGSPLYSQGYLLDITERHQAEDVLRESEARFRSMADDAPVLIWTASPDGQITFVSKTWLDFTGRSLEQELGQGWVESVHPDDRASALQGYLEAIQGQKPYEAQYRLRSARGEYRWVLDRGGPHFRPDGTLVGYMGVGVDITDEKDARDTLERRERILAAVAAIAGELEVESSWERVDIAGRLGAAAGASRTHIIEITLEESGRRRPVHRVEWVAEGTDRTRGDDRFERTLDARRSPLRRWTRVFRDGRVIRGLVRDLPPAERKALEDVGVRSVLVVPIRSDEEIWGTLGFDDCANERLWTDAEVDALRAAAAVLGAAIARQRAVRSLRQATSTLEAIVDSSPLAIVTFDRRGCVTCWNEAAQRMFGWAPHEVLGRLNPTLPEGEERRFREAIDLVLAGKSWRNVEVTRRARSGDAIEVSVSSAPLRDAAGASVGMIAVIADVTERKRVEARLLETKRTLESIIENAPHAVLTYDPEGRVTTWNDAAEEIFGWSAEEALGCFNPTVAPGEEQHFRETVAFALEGGSRRNTERPAIRRDGTSLEISASVAPLRDADGKAVGMVALVADITSRRRAERRLAAQHAVTAALAESAALPQAGPRVVEELCRGLGWDAGCIWVPDRERALLEPAALWHGPAAGAARFAEATLGTRLGAGEGPAGRAFAAGGPVWTADLRADPRGFRGTPGGGAPGAAFALPFSAGEETLGVLEFVSRELAEPDEEELALLTSTARQLGQFVRRGEADLAVREREERFRTLVANVPGTIYRCNHDANWTMSYLSDTIAELSGYPAADFIGGATRTFGEIIHPDDREDVAQRIARAVAAREPYALEYRIVHRSGELRWVSEKGQPIIGPGGEVIWLDGVIFDVTERERLLAQLEEQNEQLRELDRLKDEFVALVSHELRTPLTSILGYLELVLEGDAGDINDDQAQFLRVIERNSRRLLRLVGDLLFIAQIEAGRLAIERHDVDLGALARECVEAARPRASEKEIELVLEGDAGPTIPGDGTRIAQLLDNLVSNAIKFTPERGRIGVRLSRENGQVLLAVADTGMGISEEDQARLFERFYRTSRAAKHAIQGTGLGLTISKAIAEAHGGSIAVESREGQGAIFRVRLPVSFRSPPGSSRPWAMSMDEA